MRCLLWGVLLTFILSGCGGGGGGSSGDPANYEGDWGGRLTSLFQYSYRDFSDFSVAGNHVKDFWVGNTLLARSTKLHRRSDLSGHIFEAQSERGVAAFFFSDSGQYAAVIAGPEMYGVFEKPTPSGTLFEIDDINGNWAGSFFYEWRGYLHQLAVEVNCSLGICSFSSDEQQMLSFDFVKKNYSAFYPESGAWFGRQIDSGPRIYSSALLSEDKNFMVSSMCWHSHTTGEEGFFDICEIAALERVQ